MKKLIAGALIIILFLQPLGVATSVYAETVNMQYNDPDHLHAPKEVNGVVYQYDENGNLVDDGERIISWNQDNLPVRIEKGGQIVEFFYNADGRRIAKKIGEDKTVYVNQYLTIEQLNNETIPQKYYFANGRIGQEVSDNLSFLHQNYLGSTVLATDFNSQVLGETLSYFPYGNHTKYQILNTKYLFTGQEKDPETDLYNYNARLYNPTTGSFISADTVGGDSRYSYAESNPMIFTDPTGNQSLRERIDNFLGEADIPPEWHWLGYTRLINPFFYFDKFIEKPIAEKYNISASLTIGTVGALGASAYEGAKWLSFAKDYTYYNYFYSGPAELDVSQAAQTTSAQVLTGKEATNAIAQRLNQAADLVKQGANEEAVGLLTDKAFAKSVGISIDPFVAIGDSSPTDLAYKSMSWESGRLTVPTGIYEVSSGGDISVSYPTKVTELLLEEWHHAALRLGGFQGDVELPVYRWFEMRGIPHTPEFGQRYGRAEWWASLGD